VRRERAAHGHAGQLLELVKKGNLGQARQRLAHLM